MQFTGRTYASSLDARVIRIKLSTSFSLMSHAEIQKKRLKSENVNFILQTREANTKKNNAIRNCKIFKKGVKLVVLTGGQSPAWLSPDVTPWGTPDSHPNLPVGREASRSTRTRPTAQARCEGLPFVIGFSPRSSASLLRSVFPRGGLRCAGPAGSHAGGRSRCVGSGVPWVPLISWGRGAPASPHLNFPSA